MRNPGNSADRSEFHRAGAGNWGGLPGPRRERHAADGMVIDQVTGPPSERCLRRGQPELEVRWTSADCAFRAACVAGLGMSMMIGSPS